MGRRGWWPLPLLAVMLSLSLALVGPRGSQSSQMGTGRPPSPMGSPGPGQTGSPPPKETQSESLPQSGRPAPPFDLKDEEIISAGAVLFATSCSYCHKGLAGATAGGGVPTLRDPTYEREYLFRMISDGPPSRRMPAWKHQYSPEQIWKLVAYILSLKQAGGG